MASNRIKEQVNKLLSVESNKEDAKAFLVVLRDNLKASEESIQRISQSLLVLVVGFELISRATISEASIGGFKLTDLTLIQKIIPVGIAYLYYYIFTLYARRMLLLEVHDKIMAKVQSSFYENNLEFYAHPPSNFGTEDLIRANTKGLFSKLIFVFNIPIKLAIGLGPAVFIIYAFYRCFLAFGNKDILVWIGLVISIMLVFQTALLYKGTNQITD